MARVDSICTISSFVMFRQATRKPDMVPFGGFNRISAVWICLLMFVSVTLCQSSGANGSTPLAAESSPSPSPTHFPPSRDTLPTSGAGAATEISSSTSSRLSKSKEPTPPRIAPSTPASVHTASSSARLRSISGEKIITSTKSESTLLVSITAATPKGGSGGSVAFKNSETPSPSTYAGRSSAAFSSRSVFSIKSDLHVITSDVPTPVVASKRFRLSYSTGVESGASSLSTPPTTKTTSTTTTTTSIPTLNSLSTTAQPPPKTYKCQVGSSGKRCVCLNCRAGKNCCIDEIHNTSLENGVLVAIRSITTDEFISKMDSIRNGLADVVIEACSDKHCAVEVEDMKNRRKRSAESDGNLAGGPVKSSAASFSGVEPKSPQTLNFSRVVGAVVVIFEFTQKKAPSRGLNASFFVQTTTQRGGDNTTGVLNGTVLFGILEEQASAVERRLNLSLLPISKWRRDSGARSRSTSVAAQDTVTTAVFPDDTTTPTVTAEARGSTKKMSQTTLILIITAGCLGFLALLVLAFYLGKYFSRKMNGEFVPGKIYHSSDESSNPDLLPAFVDPSAPRITDVPHKATRAQSSANSTTGGQSSGGAAAKKQKKPMGVKITYKPPKWD